MRGHGARAGRVLLLAVMAASMTVAGVAGGPAGAQTGPVPRGGTATEALVARAEEEGRIRLIVQLDSPSRGPAVARAAQVAGGGPTRTFEFMPHVAVEGSARTIRSLAAHPGVVSVTEDIPEPPALVSALGVIGAPAVHAGGLTGAGATVAILDTGIDGDHPFFADNNGGNPGVSRILSQACFSDPAASGADTEETLCPNGTSTDLTSAEVDGLANCLDGAAQICSHGTHVAGIAAGDGTGVAGSPGVGVAPDANIIAIQVFTRFDADVDCGGPGSAPCVLAYVSDQIAGLNRVAALAAANPGWNVVAANMSLGGGSFGAACDGDPRKGAIDTLLGAGIATAIAAGNNAFLNAVGAPGCISTAVTVGSTTDADAVSGFSNRGPLLDLFAPGSAIDSAVVGGWANFNGTSMATPMVAGALAVLREGSPASTIGQLVGNLVATGVPITYTTGRVNQTTPRIDLTAAAAVANPCISDDPADAPAGYTVVVLTAGHDSYTGTAANEAIYGLGGNDFIDGGGGNDLIFGGPGNDGLFGGPGNDALCAGDGNDLADSGDGNDHVEGQAGYDQVRGGSGDDTLLGGDHNDQLDGGPGTDSGDGGAGADECLNVAVAVNCP